MDRDGLPTVLVVSLSELRNDARVLRQIGFLAPRFKVVVAALGDRPQVLEPEVEYHRLTDPRRDRLTRRAAGAARVGFRLIGSYGRAYWSDGRMRRWRDQLGAVGPVDAVVVNDLHGLPLAREAAPRVPIVFDAHEHWTSESATWSTRQRLSMRRAHDWIVDRFVPGTEAMMTVSDGIARDFERRTGIAPQVVTNAPPYADLSPSRVSQPVRLVHMGVADERRRLEGMIEAVRLLDERFSFDLVLARDNEYRRRLEQLAGADPRVRILPAVPSHELVGFANQYDVGVYLFPAKHPNQLYSLPNKLFDFIQARLAVAIGPSPEMARIVREWDCGVVSESFDPVAFAEALRGFTVEEIERMKANSDRAARVLCAERNRDLVVSIVEGVLSAPSGARNAA